MLRLSDLPAVPGPPPARPALLRGALLHGALVLFGLAALAQAANYLRQDGPLFPDFFGLWSWARLAATHGAARIYDPAVTEHYQAALDPRFVGQHFPFLYPPSYLLLLLPLGTLGYTAARLAWAAATLAAFLVAVLGRRWSAALLALALLAPSTVVSLIYGQNGFLTAALLIGGLRCAGSRPILAGALLGLLTCKPQLAILVPVALAAGGQWRALLAMALASLLLVVVTAATFGPALWIEWLRAGPATVATVRAFVDSRAALVPTVGAALHTLGAGPEAAALGQLGVACAACWAVAALWRRDPGSARAVAAVPVATLLATPYAFVYDLPMVTGAVLLLLENPSRREAAIFGLALALPQLMLSSPMPAVPLGAPVLSLLLLWIVRTPAGFPSPRAVLAPDQA